jgi:hypothetical protein
MSANIYTYKYLKKEDKVAILEDIIFSMNSYINIIKEKKDLILLGGNSQRSIQGIDAETLLLQNSINVLNDKKQQIIQEE